jgi:hypothetical protein
VLEKLAGPFTRFLPNGSTPAMPQWATWVDELGLCAVMEGASSSVTQIDGATYKRATLPNVSYWPFIFNDDVNALWIGHDVYGYTFDKIACTISASPVAQTADGGIYFWADCIRGGYAYRVGASYYGLIVERKTADFSAYYSTIATAGGFTVAPSGQAYFSKGAVDGEIYLTCESGPGISYNIDTNTFGTRFYLPNNKGAWYSKRLGAFVVLLPDNSISIYATTPKPASLSNPTDVSGFASGQISSVRVRLLGSNSEPCAGELVDWSITAGGGAMLDEQTTTNATGYAYARYLAPLPGGANPTISAKVEF